MNFIDHKKHKVTNKEKCYECIKETQEIREALLDIQIDDYLELQQHSHRR